MQPIAVPTNPRICIAFYRTILSTSDSAHRIWLTASGSHQILANNLSRHLSASQAKYWVIHDFTGFLGFEVPEISTFIHLRSISKLAEAAIAKNTSLMSEIIGALNQAI